VRQFLDNREPAFPNGRAKNARDFRAKGFFAPESPGVYGTTTGVSWLAHARALLDPGGRAGANTEYIDADLARIPARYLEQAGELLDFTKAGGGDHAGGGLHATLGPAYRWTARRSWRGLLDAVTVRQLPRCQPPGVGLRDPGGTGVEGLKGPLRRVDAAADHLPAKPRGGSTVLAGHGHG